MQEGKSYKFTKYSRNGLTMKFKEYEDQSRSTAMYQGLGTWNGVIYNTLKLSGEAGEVSDKVGKIFGKGETPTPEQIQEIKMEASDCLWHLTNLILDLGFSLEEVAEANIKKLKSRQERGMLMNGSGDNR